MAVAVATAAAAMMEFLVLFFELSKGKTFLSTSVLTNNCNIEMDSREKGGTKIKSTMLYIFLCTYV